MVAVSSRRPAEHALSNERKSYPLSAGPHDLLNNSFVEAPQLVRISHQLQRSVLENSSSKEVIKLNGSQKVSISGGIETDYMIELDQQPKNHICTHPFDKVIAG